MTEKTKLLYVAGFGRSGSTILGNVLGSIPGCVHLGEVCFIWLHGVLENQRCGCGQAFHECNVWKTSLDKAFGSDWTSTATRMLELWPNLPKHRAMLVDMFRKQQAPRDAETREFLEVLRKLYRAVAQVTGATVLVDSSKLPWYAALLGSCQELDLSIVHLVRDPRATTHAWSKRQIRQDTSQEVLMQRMPLGQASAKWLLWNWLVEASDLNGTKPLFIRYEDFTRAPSATIGRILETLSAPQLGAPVFEGNRTVLSTNHCVWGNPTRAQTGPTEIRGDDAWHAGITPSAHLAVSALTAPLLLKYGYHRSPR